MPEVKAVQFLAFVLLSIFAMPGLSGSVFAAPPLSVYGKLPGFEMAAISSSGDHVALIGTVGEERRLIVLDKELKPVKTALVGDAKIRRLQWVGDMAVLLEQSNTAALGIGFTANKAELYLAIVFPIDKSESWAVFAKNPHITGGVRSFYGLNQRDGQWFAYYGGITLESSMVGSDLVLLSTDPVLYEVDLQTRRARKIASRIDSQENDRDWLVGSDGKVSATLNLYAGSGTWEIRNRQGQKIAGGKNALGRVNLVSFGATPDSIIYSEEEESGEQRWFEVPLAGSAAKEVLQDVAIRWRLDDKRANRLIGYALDGDTLSYHFFDPHRQKVVAATQRAFPGVSMKLIDWNDRFDRLIVMTEGNGDPQTWWLVDIKTGKADPLGTSYPMADKDVAPMKMIRYKAGGDGTEIPAVLTLPPGIPARNLPVIVFPHGGPGGRDYPEFDWWAQAFAVRGYAVLQPNFRGSTGYGAAFENAGHGEWGRKMQTDVSDGLGQLVRDGIADPKRACIMGGSYGGYAALAGVTLQKGLYRCAVSVAGVSDVARMARTDLAESGGNPMLRRALKEELGSGRDLAAVSPIRFAANADAPVLLIHGKDDTVVLYEQSNDMAKALRAAGKPVEFVTLAGEDHWLSRSETRLAMLEAAVAFVEKHNPPGPVQ